MFETSNCKYAISEAYVLKEFETISSDVYFI